jgi:4-amino-4-deoxy-L-arabinose transferase-like glycosyltransferase
MGWAVGGRLAGLPALGPCVLNPEVITHAQLCTTDMGLAAFAFASCYALAVILLDTLVAVLVARCWDIVRLSSYLLRFLFR